MKKIKNNGENRVKKAFIEVEKNEFEYAADSSGVKNVEFFTE